MRFKLFTIFMAIAVALAFSSCDGKKKKVRDDDDDSSSQSESVEKGPTGDPKKDAKILVDRIIELYEDATTIEELKEAKKEADKLDREFKDFYKQKDDNRASFEEFKKAYKEEEDRMEDTYDKVRKKIESKDDSRSTHNRDSIPKQTAPTPHNKDIDEEIIVVSDEDVIDVNDYGPTGNIEWDARVGTERLLSILESVNSKEDLEKAQIEFQRIANEYNSYYEKIGKLHEFSAAANRLEKDPSYKRRIQQAQMKIKRFSN